MALRDLVDLHSDKFVDFSDGDDEKHTGVFRQPFELYDEALYEKNYDAFKRLLLKDKRFCLKQLELARPFALNIQREYDGQAG